MITKYQQPFLVVIRGLQVFPKAWLYFVVADALVLGLTAVFSMVGGILITVVVGFWCKRYIKYVYLKLKKGTLKQSENC